MSPISGAEVRLTCSETLLPDTGDPGRMGAPCDPRTGLVELGAGPMPCSAGHATPGNPATLACDAFDERCALPCTADADCVAAGLPGYACDGRLAASYFGSEPPDGIPADAAHHFCVSTTCGPLANAVGGP